MIPVLDWSRFAGGADKQGFAADLGHAARETGFFLLANHGIADATIDRAFAQADAFFAMPEDRKAPLDIRKNGNNRGWAAPGSENLDDTGTGTDRKQAFNIGLEMAADDPRILAGEPFRGVNIWPDLPGFREAALAYFEAAHQLGVDLHRAIALDLGLSERHFDSAFDAPLATLRFLDYPGGGGPGLGAGAHSDYGSITLLMTDGEPGLQVRPRGGDWLDVPHIAGAFVVNIGDCLMRWTNDIYVSTPHRVLVPRRRRRSIAFFLDPNPEAVIAALPGTGAPKYDPVTGADYLRSRLDATYRPKETGS